MIISTALWDALPQSVKPPEFQGLVARLFSYGVICRNESSIEETAYDSAMRVLDLLEDYFLISGYRLVHIDNLATLLLYPPVSRVPGCADDQRELYPGPRQRLSPDTVAMALTLKLLYLEGFNDGRADQDGDVIVTYDAVLTALHTQLRREPPKAEAERLAVFKRLRSYRIVKLRLREGGFQPDTLVVIRPLVIWLVSDEFLSALSSDTPGNGEK